MEAVAEISVTAFLFLCIFRALWVLRQGVRILGQEFWDYKVIK